MSDKDLYEGSFMADMSPKVREKLMSLAQTFHFKREELVFQEGSPSVYLFIVKSGRVSVDIHIPSKGRRQILTAGPGEVVSWSALVQPCVHHASARAVEESEMLGLRGDLLASVCEDDHQVGYELFKTLAEIVSSRLTATRLQMLDVFATA